MSQCSVPDLQTLLHAAAAEMADLARQAEALQHATAPNRPDRVSPQSLDSITQHLAALAALLHAAAPGGPVAVQAALAAVPLGAMRRRLAGGPPHPQPVRGEVELFPA